MMRRKQGFTLIELLTVIAVLSVVGTLGASAFFEMTGHWNRTRTHVELEASATRAIDRLRLDVGSLVSSRLSGVALSGSDREHTSDDRFFRMALEDDSLVLPIAFYNPKSQHRETALAVYRVERAGATSRLTRALAPVGEIPDTLEGITLSDRVIAFQCAYFDGESWSSAWSGATHPEQVRVNLLLTDENDPSEQLARRVDLVVEVD